MIENRVSFLECEKRVGDIFLSNNKEMREEQEKLDPIREHFRKKYEKRFENTNLSEKQKQKRIDLLLELDRIK